MKNFISLIFLMAIGLSSAWAQFDLVDDNPPCIEDGGNLNYNVLSNDILPAGMNIIVVTLESDPCFYIDEQGTVHTNPNSGVDCCGDHHLVYSIIDPELGATIEPAILNICVECAKPDCALINLEDYLGNTGDGTTPGEGGCIHVCENSVSTLFVPYNSNNLYAWQVLAGGTGVIGANPAEYIVTWGAAGLGIVKLDITDANGTTSFTFCFDIMEAPNTSFTGPVYICLGQNACFTNTTPDGDVYFWDFGDGGTSNLENPCYEYANPGTYTVTLCASNYNYDENGNQLCCCTSCVSMEIVVDPLPGPSIYCISTLCEGDEACYTTDATNCSSYLWTVLDADGNPTVPFTGQGTNQICVTWGAGPFGTITLDVSGCDDAYCNNPSTAVVPIISTLGIIDGPTTVCEGSTETYSLPKWMSVLYDWTVTGGTILNGDSTHIVTIEWGSQGVGTIHVDYCSQFLEGLPGHEAPECCGTADLTVNILPAFNVTHSGPSTVCVGTTSYFSATSFPYNSYSWTVSPSVPFTVLAPDQISIAWTSGMAGTYTITATPNAPGQYCNTSDAIVVTVVEVPPADDIDGPLQVCENDIYYYTAVSSTPGVSFSWVATNGTPATGSGTTIGIAWGNGGGTLTLYQVMTSPPFCNSDPISITVTEKQLGGPFTIAGSANCTNTLESYVLSPAPHPDATIFWYVTPPAAGSIVGGQGTLNPQVQWNNTPGGVSLNVDFTLCNQVTTINQPLNLVSPQVPVIVQNGNICPGGGGTLDATLGFSSYQWSTGNTTPSTPVTAGGLYSLITVDNNNCTATTYFTANATPGPLASVSSGDAPVICITNPHTVTMVAPFNLNYSVEWYCNNVLVAGPGPVYSYQHVFQNTPGIYVYHIVVTDITTGCISTSLPFVVEESTCPPPPGCTPDPCALFPTAVNQTPYCNVVDFGFTPCPNFTFSSWSFGDLTTSGSPNPSHQYTQAGCYNATVCGSVPGIDPVTHLPCIAGYCEDISVCVPIAAEFDWTTGVCSNMLFTDMSTIIVGPGNAINSWNWTFCDINNVVVGTSSTQNPTFNFPGPGTYIVKLEVCNSNGCCAQISHNIVVGGVGTPVITINPTPACAGTPLFYSVTATNAVSYFWDFGDGATFTGQNPQHTYTSGNTYLVTVVATDPNGCTSSNFVFLLVYPPVPPATITGTLVICQGQTTTLCAPAGYSYVWTPGGQLTQCINVGAGTYGVTIEDANGCQLELDPVEVVELPLPNANISGPAVICDAGCVYLSVPYVSGNSYQWLDDNLNPIPFEIYNQIYVCDYNLLPSYSVIVTDQNGCSVQSAPHVISLAVSPDVSVTISPMPCAGQPVTLTATSSFDPNISYVWSNGGTGNTITVTQAGDYTVVATNTITGCSSNETVTIFPLPDFCILPQGCYEVCNPDTVCGPPGLASYQWNLNGNPITGETSQCLIVTQDGTYTLTGTTVNGCTDTSADLVLTVIDCSSLCDSLILDYAFLTDADGNVDSCCVSLSYTNNYGPLQGISISTNDADLNVNLGSIDPLLTVQSITANTLQLASITTGNPIPSGTLSNFVEFCLANVINSPQTIVIDWYDFENAIVCSDTITMHCAVEPDCAYVASDSIYCENGEITYQFTVCNPVDADFSIGFINLIPSSPAGIVIIPPFIDVTATPILPGTCQTFTVNLTGSGIEGQTFCYNLIAHQENPLIADSVICCSIDTTYCIDIPICDPCLFTSVVGVTPSDESDCCYDVTLINGNIPGVFSSIGVNVISPSTTMTVNNPFGSGWTTTGFTGTSATFVPGPLFGNTVPTGTFTIPQICIQTNIAPTQQIEITWNDGDVVLCRDTIDVFCEPPCGYLVNELIECDPVTGQWNYSAAIQNTTGYTVTHALFNFYSPGGMGAYDVTIPLGSVLPNTTSPIFNLTLGAPAVSGDVVCFTVTLIKQNSDGTDVNCCYFDDCITLPDCIVDPGCQCDEAFYMAVAQGITYTPSSLGANTYDFQLTGWAALDNCDIVRWKWGHVTPITTSAGPDVVTHTFPGPGTYDVCVKVVRTAADGTVCTASVCVTLVIPLVPAGMVELPGDLVLFPNPSTGIFKIQVEDYVTYPLQLTVFDNLQQPVKSLLVPEQPRGGILEMDLSHHAKGVYYIQFLSGDVVITQPVIIY